MDRVDFFDGRGICPITDYLASYRVLDGARFCVACGEDHEK